MPRGICPFAQWIPGLLQGVSYSTGFYNRVGFCDHTAGGYMSTMRQANFWNTNRVSAHFAISRTGDIIQLVNIFDTAFAQGRLGPVVTWPPFDALGRRNPNGYLISTEHEDENVTNRPWTEAMYQSDLRVKHWCIQECAIHNLDLLQFGIDSLVGHHQFDSVNRPYCPGLGWPKQRLYHDLVYVPPEEEEVMIRHNGVANPGYWGGMHLNGSEWMGARGDFSLPQEAKRVRLDVVLDSGYVDFNDFDGRGFAGRIGGEASRRGQVDVVIGDVGNILLSGSGVISLIGIVGYWTT